MPIFIGYIAVIGVARLLLPTSSKYNKGLIIFAGSLLFLICALRSAEFGPDTLRYVSEYISLSSINVADLLVNVFSSTGRDPFFYLISKVVNLLGASYQIWLAVIAGIFIFSVSKLIYEYSNEVYLSFVALLSLQYLYFSLTGLRQTLALSLVLLSYKYLRERKLLPFLALVFIGSGFHYSALVFLIAYPLAHMKIGFKHIAVIIAALIVAYLYGDYVRDLVALVGWTERMASYSFREGTLTASGFVIQFFIFIFCVYYKKGVLKTDRKNLSLYNLLFLGLVFQAFAIVIAEFFRISMYFSIFSIILIPLAVKAERDKFTRRVVHTSIYISFVVFFIMSQDFVGFQFLWQ